MNILIIGNCSLELYNLVKKSKLLTKIFHTVNNSEVDIPTIRYNNFEELENKAKKLQVDFILIAEENAIESGLVDFLKSKFFNVISVNQKWLNLEKSRLIAKQLLNHYQINTPQVILAPKSFPLVFKTNSNKLTKIANSMNDLISFMKEAEGETTFLEEFIDGKCYTMLSLWDGKNIIHFFDNKLLTEVQIDRLNFLKTKINFMFFDEAPNFIGFFATNIIWAKNDWSIISFKMNFDTKLVSTSIKTDFIYLLEQTIYQKLNEIVI